MRSRGTRGVAALAAVTAVAFGVAGWGPAGAQAPDGGDDPPDPVIVTGELSALTYNVAGLPEALSGSDPADNMPLISPLLNAYDLVLIQESWINPDPPQPPLLFFHEVLVGDVDHPYLSVPAVPPLATDPRRPTALVADGLHQFSRFPFEGVERIMWPDCFGGINTGDGGAGDCLSQKGFTWSRMTLEPGVEVDVYNLHGEAGSTPADLAAADTGYQALEAFIAERSGGRAVIIGGDFNLRRTNPVDVVLLDRLQASAELTDPCDVVDCGPGGDGLIDRFLYRSGGNVELEALVHSVELDRFTNPSGGQLSDHPAVHVRFGYTAALDAEPLTPDPPATPAPPASPPAAPPTPAQPLTPTPAAPSPPPATPVVATPRLAG